MQSAAAKALALEVHPGGLLVLLGKRSFEGAYQVGGRSFSNTNLEEKTGSRMQEVRRGGYSSQNMLLSHQALVDICDMPVAYRLNPIQSLKESHRTRVLNLTLSTMKL